MKLPEIAITEKQIKAIFLIGTSVLLICFIIMIVLGDSSFFETVGF